VHVTSCQKSNVVILKVDNSAVGLYSTMRSTSRTKFYYRELHSMGFLTMYLVRIVSARHGASLVTYYFLFSTQLCFN
jgi:hypothetical protein